MAFPGVEEIIMEDKPLSCINFWDTLVNNKHPLQPEEDAEPPARTQSQTAGGGRRAPRKDAEPNNQRRTQSPLARTQSLF